MTHELRHEINLLPDGTVVTADGEILGMWQIDEATDAFYQFTPEGGAAVEWMATNIPELASMIKEWRSKKPAA